MSFAPIFPYPGAAVSLVAAALLLAGAHAAPPAPANPALAPAQVVAANAAVLETEGDIHAKQKALEAIGAQPGPEADRVLLAQFERFQKGGLPLGLWLELFEAAAKRDNPELKARVAEQQQKVAASHDPLSPYRECLEGGDAASGREIFTKKAEAGCIRCHQVNGEGGQIGPDLSSIQQVTDRLYILESIVDPDAVITTGFQNVLLTMKNGETVWGVASFESEEEIVLTSPVDGKKRTLATADIVERKPLPSAMPPGFGLILGKRAVRDLVEFLATPKQLAD
jgi:putative heme-binding domain-containing protein